MAGSKDTSGKPSGSKDERPPRPRPPINEAITRLRDDTDEKRNSKTEACHREEASDNREEDDRAKHKEGWFD